MQAEDYYSYQTRARGLDNIDDLKREVARMAPSYDRLLPRWLPADRAAAIYELACGPGVFLSWIRSRGYTNATGSDFAPTQITLAKEAGLPVKLADSLAELRAMSDTSLDCLVAFDFYEHLPKGVLLEFLHDAARVLKPGGRLILHGPNGDSPLVGRAFFNDITHHWAVTSTAMRALCRMAGFRNVTFQDDVLASLHRYRILKLPFCWAAQKIVRTLLRAATREGIECLGASFFVGAQK